MVCIGRKLLFALAALQSVALAQVPADETVTLHGLTFPPVIVGADRFSLREYEKENPGLGQHQSQAEAQRFLQAWVDVLWPAS